MVFLLILQSLVPKDVFGEWDTVKLRRVSSVGGLIAFHTDTHAHRVLQVALNCGTSEFEGGRLVFVSSSGFVVHERAQGTASFHTHRTVHGVTQLKSGVRYSLLLCDTNMEVPLNNKV
jgi:hypothetical protein